MSGQLTFGSWLRQRRSELGITRDELSERVGFSLDLLRKLESGERRPSGQIAHLLADYFRIPADESEAFVTFARTGRVAASSGETTSGASAPVLSPWRRVYIHHTNLPTMLTPLIGREREGAEALDQLLQPKTRLLTLTGPPGIGKTRLALQIASDLMGNFEDGTYFVDLAPVVDPDLVLPTVARTLGLKEAGDQSIENVLLNYVRERKLLLLLDNFEQVLDAANEIVRLMQNSPWLKVLVTSREALHVRGERRYMVSPLALPDLTDLPAVEQLTTYPAVELFVERAQAVVSNFALIEANSYDVAAVCAGLEGLPLAIELAAARADHFSPREMRAALDNRLRLLTEGARDMPARQRTLADAIEWSYDLLDEQEQRFFRLLGVFVGGFAPEAAEVVCTWESDGDVSSLLLSLASKNLIRGERQDGALRYRMLETIREYAADQLQQSGEGELVSKEHALYFTRLAEEAKSSLVRANDPRPMNRLGVDYENVRAALQWARSDARSGTISRNEKLIEATERAEIGLRLAGAIWPYWYISGYISEGREEMAATLEAVATRPSLRPFMADALNGAGALAYEQGDNSSARSFYEEGLAISRETGDKVGIARTLNNLGILAHEEGDHASARSFYEESVAISREIGDKVGLAKWLNNLAELVYDERDYDYARALNEEGLAARRQLGDNMGIASTLNNLGGIFHALGDYDSARQLYEESLAIRREIGDKRGVGSSLNNLALLAEDQGNYSSALSLHQESLALRWQMGGKLLALDSLVGLGRLAASAGDAHRGVKLLAAVDTLRKAMSNAPTVDMQRLHEQGLALAQSQLGEEEFEKMWAEGRAMTMDQAIAEALEL